MEVNLSELKLTTLNVTMLVRMVLKIAEVQIHLAFTKIAVKEICKINFLLIYFLILFYLFQKYLAIVNFIQ